MVEPNEPSKPFPQDLTGRVDKYEIIRPVGKGAMGQVYLAHDTVLDRDVALKVMVAQIADDPELKQRFEREARAVAKMQHPNLVTVFDLGSHHGSPFIAMELLEGPGPPEGRAPDASDDRRAQRGGDRAGAGRARPRPPGRHRPPRHQARQHLHPGRRVGEDHGLRGGAPDDRLHDRHRQHRGNGGLHVARAGEGREGGRAQRPVQRGLHVLRARSRGDARSTPTTSWRSSTRSPTRRRTST